MLGAVFSELGAVFRALKVGLFSSCNGHWLIYEGPLTFKSLCGGYQKARTTPWWVVRAL